MKKFSNNHFLQHWLERIQPSETLILMSIAMIVGLVTAAGVWIFKQLIALFNRWFFSDLGSVMGNLGHWTVAIIPIFGGLLVGLFLHYFVGHEQYHGVSGIIESVTFAGGRLRYWRIPAKTLAAALSIGSGASVGPEDPSVQIGASVGSMIGQRLRFSDDRMRSLVAAGTASGIAAAFNAPIAGVFFALEVILGEIGGAAMGLVVLAAVISAVFTQAVSGAHPAFNVAAYAFKSVWELPLYILLGLFTGLIAVQYIKLIDGFHHLFDHLQFPTWAKPAIAGILVGLVGISLPQIFGVGYETIDHIFNAAPFPLTLLLILMVAKLILTPICVGSGFPGGVFAPALFIGATLGSA
ncbi:MAG: chloride channel protein, partial [Anaerolineales bacterium]